MEVTDHQIYLVQFKDKCLAISNTVLNYPVSLNEANHLLGGERLIFEEGPYLMKFINALITK